MRLSHIVLILLVVGGYVVYHYYEREQFEAVCEANGGKRIWDWGFGNVCVRPTSPYYPGE